MNIAQKVQVLYDEFGIHPKLSRSRTNALICNDNKDTHPILVIDYYDLIVESYNSDDYRSLVFYNKGGFSSEGCHAIAANSTKINFNISMDIILHDYWYGDYITNICERCGVPIYDTPSKSVFYSVVVDTNYFLSLNKIKFFSAIEECKEKLIGLDNSYTYEVIRIALRVLKRIRCWVTKIVKNLGVSDWGVIDTNMDGFVRAMHNYFLYNYDSGNVAETYVIIEEMLENLLSSMNESSYTGKIILARNELLDFLCKSLRNLSVSSFNSTQRYIVRISANNVVSTVSNNMDRFSDYLYSGKKLPELIRANGKDLAI